MLYPDFSILGVYIRRVFGYKMFAYVLGPSFPISMTSEDGRHALCRTGYNINACAVCVQIKMNVLVLPILSSTQLLRRLGSLGPRHISKLELLSTRVDWPLPLKPLNQG